MAATTISARSRTSLFVPRPMAFLQSGQAVTITSAPWRRAARRPTGRSAPAGRRRWPYWPRRAAAEGVLARRGGFEQFAHGFDHRTRLVVDAAAAPQFAGVVVGEAHRAMLQRKAARTNQPQDIFRMVQDLDTRQVVILAEDLEADRHDVTSVVMPCLRNRSALYFIILRAESVSPASLSGRPQQTPPSRSAHQTSSPAASKIADIADIVRGVSRVMQPAK